MAGMNRSWGYALNRPLLTPAPGSTIDVYQAGTTTHVTLYADALGVTPLANPFTTDAITGYYDFYCWPQRIDVRVSGTGITLPYTLGDVYQLQTDPANEYDVRVYGAKLDGVTDDTAAFNTLIALLNAAGGNGTIYVPAGTARLTAPLTTITVSNVKWKGDGRTISVLMWDDVAGTGITYSGGTPLATSNLSADAPLGSLSVQVVSASNFAVGNWIYLTDSSSGLDGNGTFMTRVRSVVGTTIGIEDGLPFDLFAAATAKAATYAPTALLTGMDIRDLGLSCSVVPAVSKQTYITLFRCYHPIIEDCSISNNIAPLITLVNCRDAMIFNNDLQLSTTVAACGVEVDQSTATTVMGNHTRRTRFGITVNNSPRSVIVGNSVNGREPLSGGGGRGIRVAGMSTFSVVTGNQINDTAFYGIYIDSSQHCTVSGNTIFNVGVDDLEHGIEVGAVAAHPEYINYVVVSGNVIDTGTGFGIVVAQDPATQTGYPTYVLISNNIISNFAHGCIDLLASYCTVVGNHCSTPDTGNEDISTFGGTTFNQIVDNHITRPGRTGSSLFHAIDTHSSAGLNRVTGNKISPTPMIIGGNPFFITNNLNPTDTTDKNLVTPYLPLPPIFTHTAVATNNDLLETTAWDILIPAGTFYNTSHGARIRAVFVFAANTDLKTLRVYIGTLVFTGTTVLNSLFQTMVEIEFFYTSNIAVAAMVQFNATKVDPSGFQPGGSAANGTIDWTVDQHVLLTMQNGVAVANDISFKMGAYIPEGIPAVAGSTP